MTLEEIVKDFEGLVAYPAFVSAVLGTPCVRFSLPHGSQRAIVFGPYSTAERENPDFEGSWLGYRNEYPFDQHDFSLVLGERLPSAENWTWDTTMYVYNLLLCLDAQKKMVDKVGQARGCFVLYPIFAESLEAKLALYLAADVPGFWVLRGNYKQAGIYECLLDIDLSRQEAVKTAQEEWSATEIKLSYFNKATETFTESPL